MFEKMLSHLKFDADYLISQSVRGKTPRQVAALQVVRGINALLFQSDHFFASEPWQTAYYFLYAVVCIKENRVPSNGEETAEMIRDIMHDIDQALCWDRQ